MIKRLTQYGQKRKRIPSSKSPIARDSTAHARTDMPASNRNMSVDNRLSAENMISSSFGYAEPLKRPDAANASQTGLKTASVEEDKRLNDLYNAASEKEMSYEKSDDSFDYRMLSTAEIPQVEDSFLSSERRAGATLRKKVFAIFQNGRTRRIMKGLCVASTVGCRRWYYQTVPSVQHRLDDRCRRHSRNCLPTRSKGSNNSKKL